MNTIKPSDNIHSEADLVCEALIREIRRASRWTTIIEAWKALLKVRQDEELLAKEADIGISDSGNICKE